MPTLLFAQNSYFLTSFPSCADINLHFILLFLKASAKLTVDTEKHFFFKSLVFQLGEKLVFPNGKVLGHEGWIGTVNPKMFRIEG